MDLAKTALTIAGSDSGGGAGIQADLKTFAALGVHGASIIVSLTAQNTRRVSAVHDVPLDFIKAQFEAIHGDFDVGAAKTGMLSNREIIELVAEEVGDYPLIVDPVMVAQSGDRLLKEDAIETLREALLPKAAIVTPNIAEAGVLTGRRIRSLGDMKKACAEIAKLGCSVLVKGGHLNAVDVLYHKGEFHEFRGAKRPYHVHGAGCTLAAAITAGLAKELDVVEAVAEAKKFIEGAIASAYSAGKGTRVAAQFTSVLSEAERYRVLAELKRAIQRIEGEDRFYELVPEVGVNIAYALPNASSIENVAGLSGRIVKTGKDAISVGHVEFGASKHVASIVLAAMKHDPRYRCAMNIRYSDELLKRCKENFSIAGFDRGLEPRDVSTMEWGTAKAIERFGGMPDAIYDAGGIGKEAMIRFLGKNPSEVLDKALSLLRPRGRRG